jgi:hypothetical protein
MATPKNALQDKQVGQAGSSTRTAKPQPAKPEPPTARTVAPPTGIGSLRPFEAKLVHIELFDKGLDHLGCKP